MMKERWRTKVLGIVSLKNFELSVPIYLGGEPLVGTKGSMLSERKIVFEKRNNLLYGATCLA